MDDAAVRGLARAFCDALTLREPQRVAPYLQSDVDWSAYGPIDLFPFLGKKHGAKNVVAMLDELARAIELRGVTAENVLVSGDQACLLVRANAAHRDSGRHLSLRVAAFVQMKDGKLVSLRAIFDSFDAAEQMLGRSLDLSAA